MSKDKQRENNPIKTERVFKDTNINPLISSCLENIFRAMNPSIANKIMKESQEKALKSLKEKHHETRNI